MQEGAEPTISKVIQTFNKCINSHSIMKTVMLEGAEEATTGKGKEKDGISKLAGFS